MWDPQTGQVQAKLKGGKQGVRSLAFSPDGAILAAGTGREPPCPGEVVLWDVASGRLLNHRPELLGGVLEGECAALLRDFFRDRR